MMFSALSAPPGVDLGSSAAAGDRSSVAAAPSPLLTEPLALAAAAGDGDMAGVTPATRRQLLQAFNYLLKVRVRGGGDQYTGRLCVAGWWLA